MNPRILTILAVVLGLAVGQTFAAEQKSAPAEPVKAKCCAKAEKDGKKCEHECCAGAAKEGKSCTKCGGTNPTEAKK